MARGEVSLSISLLGQDQGLNATVTVAGRAVDDLSNRAAAAGGELTQMAWTFNNVFDAAKNAVTLAAGAMGGAWDNLVAGEHASKIAETFSRAFEDVSGAMHALEVATGGAFDTTTLQSFASRYADAGFSLVETTQAMEAATKIAAVTGQDYNEVLETISDSVVQGEADGLKAYNVLVDTAKAEADYAAKIGVTVDALTAQDRLRAQQVASLSALTQKTNEYGDVQVATTQQMATIWANAITAMQVVLSDVLLPVLETLPDAIEEVSAFISDMGDAAEAASERYDDLVSGMKLLIPDTKSAAQSVGELAGQMLAAGKSTDEVRDALVAAGKASMMTESQIKAMTDGLDLMVVAADAGKTALEAAAHEYRMWEAQQVPEWLSNLANHSNPKDAPKPKGADGKGGGGGSSALPADVELILQGSYGSMEQVAAYASAQVDEYMDAFDQAAQAAGETTNKSLGLARLQSEIDTTKALQGVMDQELRARIEHQSRLDQLLREATDADEYALQVELENLRYGASERERIDQESADSRVAIEESTQARFQEIADATAGMGNLSSMFSGLEEQSDTTKGLAGMSALLGQVGGDLSGLSKLAPGSIAALGKVGAAFTEDKEKQAAIAGAMEAAASIASFATLDVVGGSMHAAAAAMYFAIAGGVGGSSGGGSASRSASVSRGRASSSGSSGGASSGGATTVYNYGPTYGTSLEGARMMVEAATKLAGSGHETKGAGY